MKSPVLAFTGIETVLLLRSTSIKEGAVDALGARNPKAKTGPIVVIPPVGVKECFFLVLYYR